MSASGATVGGLNFNNSSSAASSRVSLPLAPVADAGKSYMPFVGSDISFFICHLLLFVLSCFIIHSGTGNIGRVCSCPSIEALLMTDPVHFILDQSLMNG